ncbi:hypothetical protein [Actinomyces sp. MRS3W]|uniref:hypothetical protein n=1 Tax=Actinomyces sp. MRS3W TaxID=2800796 RepID=UPI0028FD1CCB|nr:hypothetical protein [Actinomyces sp. MRS3W]MDU0349278.1 hypothetical protein [Actinomyces sp. MRS3W]
MHRRRYLMRRTALLTAVALAACAACSATPAGDAASSAPASAAPSRSLYGTNTPLAANPNFEESGLTATTLSIKAEADAVVTDDLGITYVEPRTDNSADLKVHRASWDGSEVWSATVPVPDDAQDMSVRLSQDPAIGVVSVWLRGPNETDADGALILQNTDAMAGEVTWLDVSTGEAVSEDLLTIALQFEGTAVRTNEDFAGAIVMESDSVTSAVVHVDADLTPTGTGWGDLVSSDADLSLSNVSQWQGMPLFTLTDKASGANTVQLGTTELLTTDDEYASFILGSTHLALRESGNLWLVDSTGTATKIDTAACELGNNAQYPTISQTALYAGLARVTLEDQSVECLADLSPTQDAKITGEFSDGSVLLTSALSNADVRGTWLIPADRSQAVELDSLGPVEVYSDHIVNIMNGSDTTNVDVYDYRDLLLP